MFVSIHTIAHHVQGTLGEMKLYNSLIRKHFSNTAFSPQFSIIGIIKKNHS